MTKLSLIAAMSNNRVIGANNSLPWRLPSDLKKFKELTVGKIIIMGRKTFESIGSKPLPERMNFVVTRDQEFADKHQHVYQFPNMYSFTSLTSALHYAAQIEASTDEVMIIGGATLFAECLPFSKTLYLSTIDVEVANGDTLFPEFNREEWEVKEKQMITDPKSWLLSDPEKKPLTYTFEKLERKAV